MAIHYTFTLYADTLIVRAAGFDESLADVTAYAQAIITACVENGRARVLCDERALEYRLSAADTYAAAQFLARDAPHVSRAAIVCQPQFLSDARFWEDVAVNRGLTVRAFTDLAAAWRWLGHTEAAPEMTP